MSAFTTHSEFVKEICDQLIVGFPEKKKKEAVYAYQKFNEYLMRLEFRYNELVKIDTAKANLTPELSYNLNLSLHDIQLMLLDKIEAYHQQVYATASSFILLLSHVGPKNFVTQMPIRGVTKFINWIQSKDINSANFEKQSLALLDSTTFRSKFIDHPQQHALHDWLTFTSEESSIIYYIRTGDNVYFPTDLTDPYVIGFEPPVDCRSFYVSPKRETTKTALISFTKHILKSLK